MIQKTLLYNNKYIKVYLIKNIEYSYDVNKYYDKPNMPYIESKELGIKRGAKVLKRKNYFYFDNIQYPTNVIKYDIQITGTNSAIISFKDIEITIDRCEAYDNFDFHYYHNGIANRELERIEFQAHLKTQTYMLNKEYEKLQRSQYNEKYNDVYSDFKKMILSNYEYNINIQKEEIKHKQKKMTLYSNDEK